MAAALIATAFGVGGWMVASQWSARADARPNVTAVAPNDRQFNNIYYKIPRGYLGAQPENGVVMARQADAASGNLGGVLIITPGFPFDARIKASLKANSRKDFVQGIAIAAGNLSQDPDAELSIPQAANDHSRDRYEAYSLKSRSQDKDAGQLRITEYRIILSDTRADVIMRVGYGTQANFDSLAVGFNYLVSSIVTKSSGAPAPTRLAAPLPTDLSALITQRSPAAAPQPSTRANQSASASSPPRRGGDCRVVQQQMCTGGFATGRICNTFPQTVCD